MNLTSGIIEVDLHGIRTGEAIKRVKSEVNKASGDVGWCDVCKGWEDFI